MKVINQRIFEKLKEYRMSQAEFSRQTGISTSTINDWKTKDHTPAADKIMIICNVLEMTPEELLSDEDTGAITTDKSRLMPGDRKILDDYHNFTERQQKRLLSYMKRLTKENTVARVYDSNKEC